MTVLQPKAKACPITVHSTSFIWQVPGTFRKQLSLIYVGPLGAPVLSGSLISVFQLRTLNRRRLGYIPGSSACRGYKLNPPFGFTHRLTEAFQQQQQRPWPWPWPWPSTSVGLLDHPKSCQSSYTLPCCPMLPAPDGSLNDRPLQLQLSLNYCPLHRQPQGQSRSAGHQS